MDLGGLHHVTAVTGNASANVAFYTEGLGLRLVKKTVNQDDVSAYHLFYADQKGSPGTDMTFFDWPTIGQQRRGAGMTSATAFRVVGRGALDWWTQRLDNLGVVHGEIVERDGREVLPFADPEGQSLELVDDSESDPARGMTPGTPWSLSPVPVEHAIRGLEGVTLSVQSLEPTSRLLTDVLGFRKTQESSASGHTSATFEVGPGGAGTEVRVVVRPDMPRETMAGSGGVHHVAFRTPNDDELAVWQERLAHFGLGVTPVIDRFYFHSIYFREPGGVLFELATDGPGFSADEDPEHLGEKLSLPPFLESRRAQIEANLKPIALPRPESARR